MVSEMRRTERVPSLELTERNCHRLKAVFRKCVGNASGSRQGEAAVVLNVAGVNGRLRESILKDTLSKSGTADTTSSLFLRRSFFVWR